MVTIFNNSFFVLNNIIYVSEHKYYKILFGAHCIKLESRWRQHVNYHPQGGGLNFPKRGTTLMQTR
jgi:hypothetical protein